MRILITPLIISGIISCDLIEEKDYETYIMVYISSGAIQCEYGGDALDETAKILTDAGIDVIESVCGYLTGVAFPAACGMGNGDINLHRINFRNRDLAIGLGFSPVSWIQDYHGEEVGFATGECKNRGVYY